MRASKLVTFLTTFVVLAGALAIFVTNTEADPPYADQMWFKETKNVVSTSGLESSWAGAESDNYGLRWGEFLRLSNGSIIATLRAWYNSGGDTSPNDEYFIRSHNNGSTWTDPEPFLDGVTGDDDVVCGCAMGVTTNGRIWSTYNDYPAHEQYLMYSDDNGYTWKGSGGQTVIDSNKILDKTKCYDLETMAGLNDYTWHNGLYPGLQLSTGRYLMSAYCSDYSECIYIVYSDNADAVDPDDTTWAKGSYYGEYDEYSENVIVELNNGTGYMTIRDAAKTGGVPRRHYAFIEDIQNSTVIEEAKSPSNSFKYHDNLNDPETWGHVYRLTSTLNGYDENRILLCWNNNTASRDDMTIAVSYDECQTWAVSREINDDEYPKLFVTDNKTIIVGAHATNPDVAGLDLLQFNIEWVTQGEDSVTYTGPSSSPLVTVPYISSINSQQNNTVIEYANQTIIWTITDNTSFYELQIANDSAFTDIFLDLDDVCETNYSSYYSENSTHVTFQVPPAYNLKWQKPHYYRVRARYEDV